MRSAHARLLSIALSALPLCACSTNCPPSAPRVELVRPALPPPSMLDLTDLPPLPPIPIDVPARKKRTMAPGPASAPSPSR